MFVETIKNGGLAHLSYLVESRRVPGVDGRTASDRLFC